MTCQLAQLLAPIKSASAPLSSVTSEAAAAVVKDAGKAGGAAEQEAAEFEAAAAAVASAEADEAALDAAADALLTQLGLMASEHATAGEQQLSGLDYGYTDTFTSVLQYSRFSVSLNM